MPADVNVCPACQKPCSGLYQSKQHGLVCFSCLDEVEPEIIDRYDGWRDREVLHDKRRSLAQQNFCLEPRQ